MNYKVKENFIIFIIVSLILIATTTLFILLNIEEDLVPNQWVLETVIFLISFLLFIIPLFVKQSNLKLANSKYQESKSNSKNKTKKIKVDLSKCKLECNSSYERVESNNPANITDHWEGLKPSKNVVKNNQKSECILVFEMEWEGKPVRFESETIFKDEITLRFLLEQKKEIDLYIKPNGRYFFDLDFLLEPHER